MVEIIVTNEGLLLRPKKVRYEDPVLEAVENAPMDDERLTKEEQAIAEAEEDIRAGRTRSWTEVRRELK